MKRPIGITITSIILFLAAVIALIVGISVFISGTPLDILWTFNSSLSPDFKSSFIGMLFGIFILVLGLIILYTVWGLLKGNKWAWWITIIIFTLNAMGDLARLALGSLEGIVGILIVAIFLFYLTRPGVRAFFDE